MIKLINRVFKTRPGEWTKVGILSAHLLAGTAILVLILSTHVLSIRALSVLVLSLSGIALMACVRLKKPYAEKLKEALSSRNIRLKDIPELGDLVDRQSEEMVEQGLKGTDRNITIFSLELVRDHPDVHRTQYS